MRKASSMLELVIAIVVMGISVMTLPILLSQTEKNNSYAIQQEVILAARTKIGDTLTYRWDENSLINDRIVILVTDGDSELNATNGIRRIGNVFGNKRRKFSPDLNTSTPVANLGSDGGDLDDIDDFDAQTDTLQATTEITALDYKLKDFNISTTVVYVSDNADYSSSVLSFTLNDNNISHTSNIKMLTLDVTGIDFPFVLRSYSCNIGESELLRRVW